MGAASAAKGCVLGKQAGNLLLIDAAASTTGYPMVCLMARDRITRERVVGHETRLPSALFLLALAFAAPAGARDWAGSVGYASDNVYRGLSLSEGRPAWFADLHRSFGTEWVVGLAAAAERPARQSAGARLTAYLERRWQLAPDWAAGIGVAHHESPWNDFARHVRYDEVNAVIGWRGRWRVSLAVSPNTTAYEGWTIRDGVAVWSAVSFHQPLQGRLAADFGIGYADLSRLGVASYAYGNAGLAWGVGDVYLHLTWLHTDGADGAYAGGSDPGSRWVASAMWRF